MLCGVLYCTLYTVCTLCGGMWHPWMYTGVHSLTVCCLLNKILGVGSPVSGHYMPVIYVYVGLATCMAIHMYM